ncbi:DinB family protein [Kroppenstedtia eburnea]|uniref:DinB superfamily protein n=1 Tax=Kroppenstedtia eburnea TaxID=714067 RepID=A0A1N7IMT4_9BACL|nr:DinB family protein [Kroppenstedtia eburnea]QKI81989.1 DinB family protein [Kroppenstedtia eburnea]SIS38385.1 DinB superfamily protein [Kroppenstedtia eburnea]
MEQFLVAQMEMFRGRLHPFLESVSEETADQMPEGFNNTIRWNAGHILTTADGFFGLNMLPENYKALFWAGTKPADWTGDVPSLEKLDSQLREQEAHMKEKISNQFAEKLPQPIQFPNGFQIHTVGEVAAFCTTHEGIHMGYMNALKRVIEGKQ